MAAKRKQSQKAIPKDPISIAPRRSHAAKTDSRHQTEKSQRQKRKTTGNKGPRCWSLHFNLVVPMKGVFLQQLPKQSFIIFFLDGGGIFSFNARVGGALSGLAGGRLLGAWSLWGSIRLAGLGLLRRSGRVIGIGASISRVHGLQLLAHNTPLVCGRLSGDAHHCSQFLVVHLSGEH